ncbi:MAG: hypothetical protein AVDCRST_MAG95-1705 [uncultured Adhaeribacter sp.]|uniref:Outer membrane protein beta-barrel domain-containing protein n=1 Tax=uncultured Adhaeribacter sp. TaxID=448109 RepID=A0A6J4IDT2_9BACT|nr:MAG: hypothetical protein AVDCRST_MAG95-1705 [uncultured Adhaeribacter sp.]
MKKIILMLLCLGCFAGAYAQDIIIKRNGEEISATILELSPDLVKYKRFDYPDGPIISIFKSEVFMIKYANGTKETFGAPPAVPSASASSVPIYPPVQQEIKLGGPRLGFTIIGGAQANRLQDEFDVNPFLTQFGWQFETRLFTTAGGLSGLVEIVPLVGGLEQGRFVPSISGILGLRRARGFEFGVGPNLSLAGAGLVFAAGTNFTSQGLNFPVNVALVPGRDGVRVSLLFGFNSRKN